ncbi:hypothetical protein D9619_009026 [Psilocybe cf. subviscida]|uniref:Galactose oxidase n=1 Tax=Psilocybe cf. subviscida TaxID=2480587 RepID=A0A8H5BUP4_9AGAR|nr:hypothetical protein D9619_009026 [Psilocybe cf. subviscida]
MHEACSCSLSMSSRSSSQRVPSSIYSGDRDGETASLSSAKSSRNLPKVPEEGSSSPYLAPSPAASTSTFSSTGRTVSKPSSSRTLGKSSSNQLSSAPSLSRRSNSTSSGSGAVPSSEARRTKSSATITALSVQPKFRASPHLPYDKDAGPLSSTHMYWSKAPVWGLMPNRTMRAHTVNIVDTTAWVIGGVDDGETSRDVFCLDTETMQWTRPELIGDVPLPCRAHTATLVDRKIVLFGGGLATVYYDDIYVLDTETRRWLKPKIAPGPHPAPRRAHVAVYYHGKIWIFGGGTGLTALSDVWTLDVSGGLTYDSPPLRWEEVRTTGRLPGPRGYHTANLVGNVLVIFGGSDGKEIYVEVSCLNLETLVWSTVNQDGPRYKRLSHTSTQVGSFVFVMGGHDSVEYTNELLVYNLVSLMFEPKKAFGRPPSPRGYQATILADSRLFLFGGSNGLLSFDDVYILDLAANAYLPQVTTFAMDVVTAEASA